MAVNVLPHSTTGSIGLWGGTKDDKDAYFDYETRTTNLNPARQFDITVQDIRHFTPQPSLLRQGYELLSHPTTLSTEQFLARDTADGKQYIEKVYFEECRQLVAKMTGSSNVFSTSFRVREESADIRKNPQESSNSHGPRPLAHLDRDLETAIEMMPDQIGAEKAEELRAKSKHFAQVNVWRPIGTPAIKWPLAFVTHEQIPDWNSEDYSGRIFSLNDPRTKQRGVKTYDCLVKHDSRYAYRYASNMTPDEVLIFFSFHTDPKFLLPHGAFWDDRTPEDAPVRRSIEVRHLVFFE